MLGHELMGNYITLYYKFIGKYFIWLNVLKNIVLYINLRCHNKFDLNIN